MQASGEIRDGWDELGISVGLAGLGQLNLVRAPVLAPGRQQMHWLLFQYID